MHKWIWLNSVHHFMAPEPGGAPGGAPTPPAGGAPGGGAPAGAAPAGGEWKAPDGFPQELAGKDMGESFEKLWGGYQQLHSRAEGLRTQLAQQPKAPDKPDGYAFTPSEKLAPYFAGDRNAPVLEQARAAFHKHGIPAAAFQGVIEDLYGPMIEKGLLAAPYDAKAEIKTFQGAYGLDDKATQTALAEAETFAKGLFGQLQGIPEPLKKAAEAEMMVFAETAGGMAVLRALSARLGENGIRVAGQPVNNGPLSDAELDQLTSDPRIDPRNRDKTDPNLRFDAALRQRYDEGMARRGQARFAGKQ